MGKVRIRQQEPKAKKQLSQPSSCSSEQYPWISFLGLTSNSGYNLLKQSITTEAKDDILLLYHRLVEITQKPWRYWLQMSKSVGLETIQYSQLAFSANDSVTLTKDKLTCQSAFEVPTRLQKHFLI